MSKMLSRLFSGAAGGCSIGAITLGTILSCYTEVKDILPQKRELIELSANETLRKYNQISWSMANYSATSNDVAQLSTLVDHPDVQKAQEIFRSIKTENNKANNYFFGSAFFGTIIGAGIAMIYRKRTPST